MDQTAGEQCKLGPLVRCAAADDAAPARALLCALRWRRRTAAAAVTVTVKLKAEEEDSVQQFSESKRVCLCSPFSLTLTSWRRLATEMCIVFLIEKVKSKWKT